MDEDLDGLLVPAELDAVRGLVIQQRGLVTTQQCLSAGLTQDAIRHRLTSKRWVRLRHRVYQTVPGREGWWFDSASALLSVGPRAMWAYETAGYSYGLSRCPPELVHVLIDAAVKHRAPEGVRVHRCRHAHDRVDDLHWPWRTSIEETIVDLAEDATVDEISAMLGRAFQRGSTSEGGIKAALSRRKQHRRRALLAELLTDVAGGAESAMEVRFVRDVERAHGLPPGRRQASTVIGSVRVHDVGYDPWQLLLELDGRLGHVGQGRVRDGRRDRRSATRGWLTIRAFWSDVAGTPCELAMEVGSILTARGWTGRVHPCRQPSCTVRN